MSKELECFLEKYSNEFMISCSPSLTIGKCKPKLQRVSTPHPLGYLLFKNKM
jgi:hypothetical protein